MEKDTLNLENEKLEFISKDMSRMNRQALDIAIKNRKSAEMEISAEKVIRKEDSLINEQALKLVHAPQFSVQPKTA